MAESLQSFPLDLTIDGQEVAPELSRFATESLRFANFYDQTYLGTTSDGEFTSLQSLHPLPVGAVSTRYASNDYHGLPAILSEAGYATVSVSGEPGDFWNKRQMHPKLGFERSYFADSYQQTETFGMGLSDGEFFRQTIPILREQPELFMAFLMTLSNHHPYVVRSGSRCNMNLTRRSHGATTWPGLTLAEKTELWRRWLRGESLNAIGRALGRIAHVVRYEVARTGGIPPPARQRSRLALTLTEREAISRGRATRYVGATDQPSAAPGPVDRESGGVPARRAASFGRPRPTRWPGRAAGDPSGVAWRRTRPCVTRWPPS